MELILSFTCERDISNSKSKIKYQFRFENLASKQKTFRIVKEQHDVARDIMRSLEANSQITAEDNFG